MPDDRPVRGGPGTRDLQPDGEGATLQAEDRHGAPRGGQHHLAGHLQVQTYIRRENFGCKLDL